MGVALMAKKPDVPLNELIEYVLTSAAINLSHFPWRPHRAFKGKPEPVRSYHARLRSAYRASQYGNRDYLADIAVAQVLTCADEGPRPFEPILVALAKANIALRKHNRLVFEFPELPAHSDAGSDILLRRKLEELEPYLLHEERIRTVFDETICGLMLGLMDELPPSLHETWSDAHTFRIPAFALLPDLAEVLGKILVTFLSDTAFEDDYPAALAFAHTRQRLIENLLAASELSFEDAQRQPHRIRAPRDCKLPPQHMISAYLDGTGLESIFTTQVPFSIPEKAYREHGAIFAPSGHGKTQLLQHIIVSFMQRPDAPAMFIIDGMGTMLDKIARLEVFNAELKDRLIILEPRDVPALNFFQIRGGSDAQQIELFTYLFTAIDQGLSTKMATGVRFIVQLMQAIPGATLQTMREVMEDPAKTVEGSKYYREISALDPLAQAYFRNQFFNPSAMKVTRESIASRLYTVLANPTFNQMFSAPQNAFDALQAMQDKKIVLINTDRYFLGDDASAVFGRFVIAQCLAAALARAPVHPDQRHLALLIVDEAKDYFDAKTEKILSDARQFGLGLLFATQFVEQLPEGVRKAMYNNTAIKMAGPITYAEAVTFAREARTTPEFIRAMTNTDRQFTEFAAFIRNVTPQAIKLSIPYGTLENEPCMSDAAYAALREQNRARFAPKIPPPHPPETAPPSVQPPPKPSIKWQTPE